MRWTVLGILAGLCTALPACGPTHSCENSVQLLPLKSGAYWIKAENRFIRQAGLGEIDVEVDVDAGSVTLTWDEDGSEIVEAWTFTEIYLQ